jgi:hypothetical protein
MLRLNFRTGKGESPKLILTSFVRFCADGTLRGPENYVVARCAETGWWVGGVLHRELECEGPLRLRLTGGTGVPLVHYGPFAQVRTAGGEFYGDDAPLNIPIPGHSPEGARRGHELTILSEGVKHGQTELPTRQTTERSRAQGAPAGKTAAQAGGAHRPDDPGRGRR